MKDKHVPPKDKDAQDESTKWKWGKKELRPKTVKRNKSPKKTR